MYKLVVISVLCTVRVSIADLKYEMENNQLNVCVDDVIRNNFDQHKTLIYLKMNNDSTTLVGESNHPNVGRVVKYKPVVIIHLNMFTIDKVMEILMNSQLLSVYNYYNAVYVIVTTTPNIHLIFAYFWKKGVVNLVIISYSKMQHNYNINIYTSDPQAAGNQCGKKVVVIQKQKCNSKIRIQFPKLLRKFSNCNVSLFRRPEQNFFLSKSKSVDIVMEQLVQHLNASLTVTEDKILQESSVIAYDDFVWIVPTPKKLEPIEVLQIVFKNSVWLAILLSYFVISIACLEELANRNIPIYVWMHNYVPYFNEESPEDILYTKIRKKIMVCGDKLFEKIIYDKNTYENKSYFTTRDEGALLQLRLRTQIYMIVDNRITTSRKGTLKCEKNSYFGDTLLKLVSLFIEVGLHDHLINSINFERYLYEVSFLNRTMEENIVLNLKHLTFPFVFWVVGIFLAIFVFAVETFIMNKLNSAMPIFD
ncbi:hypothetical protein FQR65_LT08926 [Abscondita terminalis]|nr:hypothetical protein FQR65_LT08926 [Abscondita terminalis]